MEQVIKDVMAKLEAAGPCCSCCGGDAEYNQLLAEVRKMFEAAGVQLPPK